MTQKELERLKMESDPTYVPEKERVRASLKKSEAEEDEESMLHWIWNKINPHYKSSISKIELYNYLMSDKDVRDVFNFRENELVHTIESLVTDRPEQLNFEEFRVPSLYLDLHGQ